MDHNQSSQGLRDCRQFRLLNISTFLGDPPFMVYFCKEIKKVKKKVPSLCLFLKTGFILHTV